MLEAIAFVECLRRSHLMRVGGRSRFEGIEGDRGLREFGGDRVFGELRAIAPFWVLDFGFWEAIGGDRIF